MVEIMLFKVHVTKNMWHQIPGLSSFEMTDTHISSLNKPTRLQTSSKSLKKKKKRKKSYVSFQNLSAFLVTLSFPLQIYKSNDKSVKI
jgi:hypothetical protein